MKLTEKELNYILSECLKRTLNEAGMPSAGDYMNASMNRMNNNSNYQQTNKKSPVESTISGMANAVNRFRNSELAQGLTAAAAGAMMSLNAFWGGSANGIDILKNIGIIGLLASGTVAVGSIGLSLHRLNQLKNKKMPKNKLQAFKLACDAYDEYTKCMVNAKKEYAILNEALMQYNQAVPFWNKNKPANVKEDLKPLTYKELFTVVNKTTNEFEIKQDGVSGGSVKGKSQEDMRGLNIESVIKESANNMWAGVNPEVAQKQLGGLAATYHITYKLTYEWKVYILTLMKKFDFTFEEVKTKKLNGSRFGAAVTRGQNGDVNPIANDSTYTSLTLIDDNYVWVNKEDNKKHIYTIWEADNEEYYAVFKNDITGVTLNKGMTVNVPEIKKLLQGNSVINYNVKNVYAQCLKPSAFSSSVAQSKEEDEDDSKQFTW